MSLDKMSLDARPMVGALFFLSTSGDGGVTFRFDPGVDIFGWFVDPKFVSRAQSSPRMASRSCSRVSSRLMSEYRYESSLGESTLGVDMRRMWTGVTVDSRDVIIDSRDVTEFVDGDRPLAWLPNTSLGLGDIDESRP